MAAWLVAATVMAQDSDTLVSKANSQNPHGQIPIACDACHTTGQWSTVPAVMAFDHNAETGFPLDGLHKSANCKACHTTLTFKISKNECYQCHNDIHKGQLGNDCQKCHMPANWQPREFNHAMTRFPLVGRHATTDCQSCHQNQKENEFAGLSTSCGTCHATAYQNARNPDHVANGMGTDCEFCHTPLSWNTLIIRDHTTFGFALTMAHAGQACESCHAGREFAKTSRECYSCHQPDFEATSDPDHVGRHFSNRCEDCHTAIPGWKPATFDHAGSTFPMTGAHMTAQNQCASCHADHYTNTPTDCYACHRDDYTDADDPNHVTSNLSTACADCHSTNPDWKPALFDHSQTGFSMTGGHLAVENQCVSCHAAGYNNTPTDCYACHQSDFTTAADPNHVANSFSTTCTNCHTTSPDWTPAAFDHSGTLFPLTGAHLTIQNQCVSCHASGFENTPTNCYACHQADYTSTTDPNHVTSGFSTTCTNCHTTNPGWAPATFDHSGTLFPLTGAHLTVQNQCVLCHASGYNNTPADCYACHQADYTAALNPNHPGLTFPTACQGCHATTGWVPSTFNHAAYTGYALLGAHTAIANQCSQCHSGNLTSASSDCYSCHQSDYNGVTNPNHVTNNFPHDCLMCHTQNVWDPSTLNHDAQYFPIYTGRHAGEWTGCGGGSGNGAGCHTVNTNYLLFSCLHCHEHRQSEMDDEHEDVTGYSYNSEACFACHPDGNELKVRIKNFKID